MAEAHRDAHYLINANSPLQISFAQLREQNDHIARQLYGFGLSQGDRVACLLGNGIYSVTAMMATMYAGLVAVPINPLSPKTTLIDVLNHCGAKVVYASAKTCNILNNVMDQLSGDLS